MIGPGDLGSGVMRPVLVVAACVEIATGIALIVAPGLAGDLLVGSGLDAAGTVVARVAGIALLAFGIACWPGPLLAGMLVYNIGIAIFLAFAGIAGTVTGIIVWPVVALHLALTVLLLAGWRGRRE